MNSELNLWAASIFMAWRDLIEPTIFWYSSLEVSARANLFNLSLSFISSKNPPFEGRFVFTPFKFATASLYIFSLISTPLFSFYKKIIFIRGKLKKIIEHTFRSVSSFLWTVDCNRCRAAAELIFLLYSNIFVSTLLLLSSICVDSYCINLRELRFVSFFDELKQKYFMKLRESVTYTLYNFETPDLLDFALYH